jgi:hypothetical protein
MKRVNANYLFAPVDHDDGAHACAVRRREHQREARGGSFFGPIRRDVARAQVGALFAVVVVGKEARPHGGRRRQKAHKAKGRAVALRQTPRVATLAVAVAFPPALGNRRVAC